MRLRVHIPVSDSRRGRLPRSFLDPVRQQDNVCRVDAEEDVQDLRELRASLDPPEVIVPLLRPERALHRSGPHPCQLLTDKSLLLLGFRGRSVPLDKRCLYPALLAEVPIGGVSIAGVPAYLPRIHTEQPLVHPQAVDQPRHFAEGVERQLLNERYPIDKDVVDLRPELHAGNENTSNRFLRGLFGWVREHIH